MNYRESDVVNLIDNAERIAVLGSPSSNIELNLDIMAEAAKRKLVGSLGIFKFMQDSFDNYALGQITEITLQNVWTQDPTMRGLIRRKGRVDPITERHDVHIGKMMVSAVFQRNSKGNIEPSSLATVPSTGTIVKEVSDDILNSLMKKYMDEIFYLGRIYGGEVLLPLWFKHFGKTDGGIGEAYHIGIFGKTGSGKSVLAKMLVLGYAKHKDMSIFILDPQGEFSREYRHSDKFKRLLTDKFRKKVETVSLHNLVLSGDKLFQELLVVSNFIKNNMQVIGEDNQIRAARQIIKILKGKISRQTKIDSGEKDNTEITPWKFYEKKSFGRVWNVLANEESVQKNIYKSDKDRDGMVQTILDADYDEVYNDWEKIANLFRYEGRDNTRIIKDLIEEVTSEKDKNNKNGRFVIIDLSREQVPENIFWNEDIKYIIIKNLFEKLNDLAEIEYKKKRNLNTLIVIDEAHRLAPQERTDNHFLESVKKLLIDSSRTTRKYGLGWLFISQTLNSLHKEIIQQMRVHIFGFGLGWGNELRALKEIIGGNKNAIDLYQSFRDPQSGLDKKEYPFMILGPISPLSFSSLPLFLNAFKYPDEYFQKNNLIQ